MDSWSAKGAGLGGLKRRKAQGSARPRTRSKPPDLSSGTKCEKESGRRQDFTEVLGVAPRKLRPRFWACGQRGQTTAWARPRTACHRPTGRSGFGILLRPLRLRAQGFGPFTTRRRVVVDRGTNCPRRRQAEPGSSALAPSTQARPAVLTNSKRARATPARSLSLSSICNAKLRIFRPIATICTTRK